MMSSLKNKLSEADNEFETAAKIAKILQVNGSVAESGKHQVQISLDREQLALICSSMSGSSKPLQPGMRAPNFKATAVIDGEFQDVQLSDYQGKYLVLFFYPLDFTFVCPTEIISFSDKAADFKKINCEVVACSTDSHFSHLAWVNTEVKKGGLGEMKIPILADKTGEISKAYGVLKEDEGVSFRGLFIINEQGIIRQITVNDLPVGRSVDEAFRLVQAFQYTDKHGEVCPAGWKPGAKTIKPENAGEYFKAQSRTSAKHQVARAGYQVVHPVKTYQKNLVKSNWPLSGGTCGCGRLA